MKRRRPRELDTWRAWSLLIGLFLWGGHAEAQEQPPTAALLPPEIRGVDADGVGHAMERVLRTRLAELGVVRLGATPGLDRRDLQLAVGCVADSPDCMSRIAAQLEVELLIVLAVESAGGELVATLSVYRAGSTQIDETTRRTGGHDAHSEALDEVDSMVRQAFGLPAGRSTSQSNASSSARTSAPTLPQRASPDLLAPLLLIGAGVASVGAGLVLGAMSESTMARYESTLVITSRDVDVANGIYDDAAAEATAANILLPVGAGLIVAGAAVGILDAIMGSDGENDVALSFDVGPQVAMLRVRGRFDGDDR